MPYVIAAIEIGLLLVLIKASANIYETLKELTKKMGAVSDSIAELKASVAAGGTSAQKAVALLNALTAKVDELLAAAEVSGDSATVLSDLAELNTAVKAETAALDAAVDGNTQNQPPATPALDR